MIIFAWLISTVLWVGVWIPFYILGFLVTWLGVLLTTRNSEHMIPLWWFWGSNAGINGTLGYENLNWVFICNPQVDWNVPDPIALAKSIVDNKTGNERKRSNRWIWVTWRNPVTNVSRWLIGRGQSEYKTCEWSIGPLEFKRLTTFLGWSYSFTLRYSNTRGFFYRFGWKFDDVQQGRSCFIYRISPYKSL